MIDDYLDQATGGGPAQNAIQKTVSELAATAKAAESRSSNITIGAVIAAILFLITTAGVIVAAIQLYLGAQQFTQSAQVDSASTLRELGKTVSQMQSELAEMRRTIGASQPSKKPTPTP
jgi:beta-lactamase regulating signal transducer with metallopeptidase domain